MPPMAPAPAGSQRADVWACLTLSPHITLSPVLSVFEPSTAGRPVRTAFPPDRPPRTV